MNCCKIFRTAPLGFGIANCCSPWLNVQHAIEKYDKIAEREGQKRLRLTAACVAGMLLFMGGALIWVTGSTKNDKTTHAGAASIILQRGVAESGNSLRQFNKDETSTLIQKLELEFQAVEKEVRAIKATGVIMEKDDKSLEASRRLQTAAKKLCQA